MKKIALFIAVLVSSPALAWSNAENLNVDFSGKIKPEEYSSLWRWKVGTALNQYNHNATDMDQELKNLTITMDRPHGLLYGETIKAFTAHNINGMGAAPQISFSGYDNQPVMLTQEDSDGIGKGYLVLPIKNKESQKIGSLKVNVTTAAMGVGIYSEDRSRLLITSVSANNENQALYGGLVNRAIGNGHNGSPSARSVLGKFGAIGSDQLKTQLLEHPTVKNNGWLKGAPANLGWSAPLLQNNFFAESIVASSYVMGIDQGQTLNATFENPVKATTEWKAPLNVAVTYN
ncbi:TPA: hypothetical protein P8656_004245 [Escherichia coli]|nr:hypothetical protein [Escherichia coli]